MSPSYLLGYQVVFFHIYLHLLYVFPVVKWSFAPGEQFHSPLKWQSRFRLAKTREEEQLSQERTVPKTESMITNGRLPLFKDCKISDCKRNYYQRGNEMDC